MYREPALPASSELAAAELVYPVANRHWASQPLTALLMSGALSGLGGIFFSVVANPIVGAAGFIVMFALLERQRRRLKSESWVVLRIDGEDVVLESHRDKRSKGRFRLRDLDVTLDTKTIRAIQDGRSAIPAVRFMEQRAGLEHDIARIVFTDGSGDATPLTDDYVAHMDAIEWFGKIRVFLRKHGWLPEDERE